MGFLRYDSEFMLFLGRLADLMWLNILCFICSIPIVTFGAAVSAKYYTAMKLERGEGTGVTKAFFHSFKENFLQSTWLSIIVIAIVVLFGWNWLLVIGGTITNTIVVGLLSIFSVMVAITVFCMFPMLARFETKNFDAFRNALVFGIVHLPRVILGVAMSVAPVVLTYYYFKWAWLIWLFISTFALYYNAIFFIKKFQILEENTFGEVQNPYNPNATPDDEELKPLDFGEEDNLQNESGDETDAVETAEKEDAEVNADTSENTVEETDENENEKVSDGEVEK